MASPNLAAPMERTTRMSEKIRVGVSIWPIRAAYLRALTELGLSDLKIAEYLRVGPEQVACCENFTELPKDDGERNAR